MTLKKAMPKRKTIRIYLVMVMLLFLTTLGMILSKSATTLAIHMMVFCIFAIGYDVCLGFTRQCSLGHSVFFGAGAYGFILSILHFNAGPFLAILCALTLGFVLALIIGFVSVRLSEAYFVIVTAIFTAVFFLLAMDTTWLTGGDDGLTCTLPPIKIGSVTLSLYNPVVNYYFVLCFLVVSYLALQMVSVSPLGKIFISIRENAKRTEFLGYNVFKYKLAAFVISGVFAALSGGLYALALRYTSADFFNIYWSIIPIVWCLLGGLGTLIGPCLGAVIMSLFQYYVSAWWTHYLILFGVLILIVLRISHKGIIGYLMHRRLA